MFKLILAVFAFSPLAPLQTPEIDPRVRAEAEYTVWVSRHEEALEAIQEVKEAEENYQEAKTALANARIKRLNRLGVAYGAYTAWRDAENQQGNEIGQ